MSPVCIGHYIQKEEPHAEEPHANIIFEVNSMDYYFKHDHMIQKSLDIIEFTHVFLIILFPGFNF